MTLDEIKENWSNQPPIIRILLILLIIAFIYDLITGKAFSIIFAVCLILFIAAEIWYWLFDKKEE
jgi:membrane-bound ClpP family serine protease